MAEPRPWIDVPCEDCHHYAAQEVDLRRGPGAFVVCPNCALKRELHPGPRTPDGGLLACQACGHNELYSRKDFPKALGLLIVVVAAVLAPFTNYLSLFAAAGIDFVLWFFLPETIVCYVCETEHRRFARTPRHPRFDLQIADRLAYGPKAVMGKPARPEGTADGPEPEH
jgi:uncharacterized protein (DUF983 family)